MPRAKHTIPIAFKASNPVHLLVYDWLHDQAETPSELIREAVLTVYGYPAVHESDMSAEKKKRYLLESLGELTRLSDLNKAIAESPSGQVQIVAPQQPWSSAPRPPLPSDDEECVMEID